MLNSLPNKENNAGVVYCTTNLVNGKKYLGQDSKDRDVYLGSGVHFKNAVRKYGKENFQKEILQYCISQEDLNESEIYWIDYFGAVKSDLFYNMAFGGATPTKGQKQSLETIEKRVSKIRGRLMPESTRLAIKKSQVGSKRSEQFKENASLFWTGKRIGKDNAKSISVAQVDRYSGKLIKVWESACLAQKSLKMKSHSSITNVLCGKCETGYGFKWMYFRDFKQK